MKAKQIHSSQDIISFYKWHLACRDIVMYAPEHIGDIDKLRNQLAYTTTHQIQFQPKDKLLLSDIQTALNPKQSKQCTHFGLLCDYILGNRIKHLPLKPIKQMSLTTDIVLSEISHHLDLQAMYLREVSRSTIVPICS